MQLRADAAFVRQLWKALAEPSRPLAPPSDALCRRAISAGSFGLAEIEDALWGVNGHVSGVGIEALLRVADVPVPVFYHRPLARQRQAFGFQRVATTDFVGLLILLERAGLDVDPAPLVEAIKPTLAGKAFLTHAELRVHWYAHERHRCEPLLIVVGDREAFGRSVEKNRRGNGYTVELRRDEAGEPTSLWVTAPKWRPLSRRAA